MKKNIETEMESLWNSIPLEDADSKDIEVSKAFYEFSSRAGGPRRTFGWWALRVAAALMVPCAIWTIYSVINRTDEKPLVADVDWKQVEVPAGQVKSIVLPDGTAVTMDAGSRIVYPAEFQSQSRQIFFCGEGYFEVASDETHPFVISTDDAKVEVVGTKFNLRSFPNDSSVELALYEGKVRFNYSNSLGQDTEYSVSPGEMIEYSREDASLKSKFFTGREYSSWIGGDLIFRSKPLKEIASQLERTYNIRIVIRNQDLRDIPYYLAVSGRQNVDDVVELLKMDSRLRIRRVGDIIEIY